MKFIKLTTFFRNVEEALYVNPLHIGHMYLVPVSTDYTNKRQHTRIGVTTHNNGGFEVIESPEEIIKLIENI